MAISTDIDEFELMSDYLAGLPIRAIAAKYHIDEMTVLSLAQLYELDDIVRQRAIHESSVRRKQLRMMDKEVFRRDVVDLHATAIVSVQLSVIARHQKKLTRYNELADNLFTQLSDLCVNQESLDQLAEYMRDPDARYDRLNDMYRQVIALPGKVELLNKLTQSLKSLLELERKAYWIDYDKGPPTATDESAETPSESAVTDFIARSIESQRALTAPADA
jgi:hypothetical protein